jgi:hypothetical protein
VTTTPEDFAAEIIGTARTGDVIAIRVGNTTAAALADSTAGEMLADKGITLLVLQDQATAVIAAAGDNAAFAAHRAEIEKAMLNRAFKEGPGLVISVEDAATVAARHTWPTYVSSAGAHALLADYEERDPEVVVHQCPSDGEGVTPCCSRNPSELPVKSRMAVQGGLSNCTGRSAQ